MDSRLLSQGHFVWAVRVFPPKSHGLFVIEELVVFDGVDISAVHCEVVERGQKEQPLGVSDSRSLGEVAKKGVCKGFQQMGLVNGVDPHDKNEEAGR